MFLVCYYVGLLSYDQCRPTKAAIDQVTELTVCPKYLTIYMNIVDLVDMDVAGYGTVFNREKNYGHG